MRENKTITTQDTTQDIRGKPKMGKKPRAVRTIEKVPLYDKLLQPYTLELTLSPQPQTPLARSLPSTPTISLRSPMNITNEYLT